MKKLMIIIATCLVAISGPVFAENSLNYKPGLIQEALENGEIVFVRYATTWCPTCNSQARTIQALRAENPKYDRALTFVRVEWDDYQTHEVSISRNIPRRSTLIVLKGEEELGRLVAETNKEKIKNLLDLAINASS